MTVEIALSPFIATTQRLPHFLFLFLTLQTIFQLRDQRTLVVVVCEKREREREKWGLVFPPSPKKNTHSFGTWMLAALFGLSSGTTC